MDVGFRLQPIDGEIVVVEDDPLLLGLMVEILTEVGARCIPFITADDALIHLLVSQTRCVLIIADHGLPGRIKGGELAELVQERWPEISIVITSGWAKDFIGLPSKTIFLAKPWALDELVATVANLLQPGVPITKTPVHPVKE